MITLNTNKIWHRQFVHYTQVSTVMTLVLSAEKRCLGSFKYYDIYGNASTILYTRYSCVSNSRVNSCQHVHSSKCPLAVWNDLHVNLLISFRMHWFSTGRRGWQDEAEKAGMEHDTPHPWERVCTWEVEWKKTSIDLVAGGSWQLC